MPIKILNRFNLWCRKKLTKIEGHKMNISKQITRLQRLLILPILILVLIQGGCKQDTNSPIDRTVLPITEPERPTYDELDARNAKAPPRFEVKAPEKAPNVVIILLDDVGFGAPSTFGGPVQMPTLDKLATAGLSFNNFHTTALCSPTRTALKSGRNHHTANAGSIAETATAFPGNTGQIPNSVAPLAEMLRLNGYSTGAFGKWHETAGWETSISGPYDRWPTRQGFDKFYGFIGGETNQWSPSIYDGVTKIIPPQENDYHFTTDMTNQAINWVKAQQSITPDKPFFIYYAPGAAHTPHHVPKEWADKYKGKFDQGWDELRKETYERQKVLGVIPANTRLTEKPEAIIDWDSLPEEHRKLYSRQAEVYAGYLEQTDYEVGRLVSALVELEEMDNTLFIYISGDNGSSAEGGFTGTSNKFTTNNDVKQKVEDLIPLIDKWGGPETLPHMTNAWAVAFATPFTWTKQMASDFGGTRNGMVIHWPNGINNKGELRNQFGHVIDIAPTILEAASLPEPTSVNGVKQTPIEGISLLYSFNDATAKEKHTTQYFEIFGNRAIYHDGWLARTIHRAPWKTSEQTPLQSDVWDLYNVHEDFSLSNNLATVQPEQLNELQDLFMQEAQRYHVLPIDDRTLERFNPALAGRPDIMGERKTLTLYEGMNGMMENAFINVKNSSKKIIAEVEISDEGAAGVILTQGGRFGGWSLYVKDGKAAYTYNYLGLDRYTVIAPDMLPKGLVTIELDFKYDGGGVGKGGMASISINGQMVAEERIEKTQPYIFAGDETADVGMDHQTPVAEGIGYGPVETQFTGVIHKITLSIEPDL